MFEPYNDYSSTESCVLSIRQYIARTDRCRPTEDEKEAKDNLSLNLSYSYLGVQRDIWDQYLRLKNAVLLKKPKSEWAGIFERLAELYRNHSVLFVSTREPFINEMFVELLNHIRGKCE